MSTKIKIWKFFKRVKWIIEIKGICLILTFKNLNVDGEMCFPKAMKKIPEVLWTLSFIMKKHNLIFINFLFIDI